MGRFMAHSDGRYPLWMAFDITTTGASFSDFSIPQPGRWRVIVIGDGGSGGDNFLSSGLTVASGGGGGGDVKDAWGEFYADTSVIVQRRRISGGSTRGNGYEVARSGASNVSALGGFHGQSNIDGNAGGNDGANTSNGGGGAGTGVDGVGDGSPGGQRSGSVLDGVAMRFVWGASGAGGSSSIGRGGGGGGNGVTLRTYSADALTAAPTAAATDGGAGIAGGKAGIGYGAGGGGAGRAGADASGGGGARGGVFLVFMGS